MNRLYYVYIHICPDGKAYVGMTSNPKRRWEANGYNYLDHPIFADAIHQYGWNNILHLIVFTSNNKREARSKEAEIASYYYNHGISLNAGNGHSHSPSIENRRAVSIMRKNYHASEETRRKIAEGNKRRVGMKYKKTIKMEE